MRAVSDNELEPVAVVGKCPDCGKTTVAKTEESLEGIACASRDHVGNVCYEVVDKSVRVQDVRDLLERIRDADDKNYIDEAHEQRGEGWNAAIKRIENSLNSGGDE